MLDFLKNMRRLIANLFGGNVPIEDDWGNVPQEPLTPREALLQGASRILFWGALANALMGIIVLGIVAFRGASDPTIFTSLRAVLMSNLNVADDVAVLIGIVAIFLNMACLLVLSVALRAQEIWTVLVAWLMTLINIAAVFLAGFLPAIVPIVPLVMVGVITISDLRAFRTNPVMLKELRGRMRGVRGFAIITIFLSLMSFFTVLLYLLRIPQGGAVVTGELGRLLFIGVLGIELMLIIFIVPALTAGAITSERERKTYDLLQTTLISKPAFVVGKMESALGYIMLLLLSAIPLQSIAFLFGGVSETELILAFVVLTISAFTLGAFGMFFSSVTDRTLAATVRSYTISMAITFGLPVLSVILFQGAYSKALSNVATNVSNNPVTETLTIYLDMIMASLNPVTATLYSQQMLIDHQQLIYMNVTLSSNGTQIPILSPWILLTVIYLTVTAILVKLAIYRMQRQGG